ncbi:MAG: hypothetical protein GX484_13425 [Chloroflexi bacterium]|nr:hypothetical protein [Chloroflexota bacterium]
MIIFALISFLSFISEQPGVITRALLRGLYQVFGWGAFIVVFAIAAAGIYLIWRHFGNRPVIEPIRLAGALISFVALLTLMHAGVVAAEPIGQVWVNPALADPNAPDYVPGRVWEEAIACPVRPQELVDQGWVVQTGFLNSYDIARCGHGGGYIGAFIQVTLARYIGGAAVFLIGLVVLFAGVLMMTRKTLKDVLDYIMVGYSRVNERVQERRAERALRQAELMEEEEAYEEEEPAPAPSRARLPGESACPAPTPAPAGRPSIVTGLGPGGTRTSSDEEAATAAPRPSTAAAPERPGAPPVARPAPPVPRPTPAAAAATEREEPDEAEEVDAAAAAPSPPRAPLPRPAASTSQPPLARPGADVPGVRQTPQKRTLPTAAGSPGGPAAPAGRPPQREPGPSTEGERTFVQRPGTEAPGRPAAMAAPGPPRPAASPEREPPRQDEGRPAPPRPGAPAPPERRPPAWAGPGRQDALTKPTGNRPEPDSDRDEQSASRPAASAPASPASEAGPLRPGANRPAAPPRPGAPAAPGTPGLRTVVGGTSRPAPKPASPTRPPERPAADDEDEDVLFDDLSPADELENAIEIDEDEESRPSTSAGPGLRASPPPVPRPGTGPGLTRPGSPSGGVQRPGGDNSPKVNPGSSEKSGNPGNPGNPVRTANPGPARPTAGDDSTGRPDAVLTAAAKPEKVGGGSSKPRPVWKLPPVDQMLETKSKQSITDEELRQRAEIIETTLSSFGAPARVVEVNHGPVITQYGVEPDYVDGRAGKRIKVKVSKISSLADDLALALSAPTIRIEAPVPGKGYIGIEVPNLQPSIVGLKDVMDTPEFRNMKSPLRMALGQDVSGKPVVADLTSMPHLLIAGTTGSGKSVCVNGIIATFLMTCTPDQLKMIMVDPKRVELTNYNGIPHLLSPVVTELERIVGVLKWVQREMDDRYRKFAMQGARNITDYNPRVEQGKIKDEDPLPYIVVIVDELADLMMLAPDETERVITRLAQMARATGIHIILSTQRPSVDVVTGLIKANFPARIAFAVASGTDSRVILDTPGAEKLLGRGDMLFQPPDTPMPIRMQGTYVSDEEIQRITDFWREQAEKMPGGASSTGTATGTAVQKVLFSSDEDKDDEVDELFDEAVALVREKGKASISMLQRHLRIGYTRAARLIEAMEEMDIVSEHEGGSRQRNVLENGDEDE